jgi:hypothetical protein
MRRANSTDNAMPADKANDSPKHLSPAYAFGLALLCLALVLYTWDQYVARLDFPGGFTSELEAAERQLALRFQLLSLGLFLWFMFLGVAAFSSDTRRPVIVTAALYAAVIGACATIDFHYQGYLTGSGGG